MSQHDPERIVFLYTAGIELPAQKMSGTDLAVRDIAQELSSRWETLLLGVPQGGLSFNRRHFEAIRLGAPSVMVDRMSACPNPRSILRPGDQVVLADDYAGLALRMGWDDAILIRHNALHYSYATGSSVGLLPRIGRRYNAWLARRFDTWSSRKAKAVLAPAGTTEVLLRKLVPDSNILGWRPRVPRLPAGPLPTREGAELTGVFFANYRYGPNFEALKFLCEELAPAMLDSSVRFKVAGPALAERSTELEIPGNVELCGFQPDLVEFCRSADFGILPIIQGEGILLKTLTLMGYGLPLVATAKSCAGIGIRDGVEAFVADDVESMVRSIHRLTDLDLRKSMGRSAWEAAEPFSTTSGIVEAITSLASEK